MENTPRNVRYLQISGVALSLLSLIVFNLAYNYLSEISPTLFALSTPGLCMIALAIFALINAIYTFKFSANINEDSFATWLVVQYRFWQGVFITIILLVLAFLWAILTLAQLFTR